MTTKRFIVRKFKRSGEYVVVDSEWEKNMRAGGLNPNMYSDNSQFKYIETYEFKKAVQFWANWLNENYSDKFGEQITLPGKIFKEGLKLH